MSRFLYSFDGSPNSVFSFTYRLTADPEHFGYPSLAVAHVVSVIENTASETVKLFQRIDYRQICFVVQQQIEWRGLFGNIFFSKR